MKSQKMKLSIQLMIAMIIVVMGTVVLSCFLNHTFLVRYYMYHKEKELLSDLEQIAQAGKQGVLGKQSFDIAFEKMCNNGNMDILILDSDWTLVRSSSTNMRELQVQLYDIIFGLDMRNVEKVKSADNYVIAKQLDDRLDAEFLILWGTLEDGSYVYMKTALESLRGSAQITNSFFLRIGMGVCVLSVIFIFFFARGISKPIQQLSGIAKQMSLLDFDTKYQEGKQGSREIDELGHSMNEMSLALERAIADLKTANLELMQDIQKKEAIDEMRREFLSNVSHELKTPLALIQGYSEGLKECVNDDEESRQYYCEVIMDETDKMNTMVKNLLNLNQLEFGNETVELTRFNITELIGGTVQSTSLWASQEGIEIKFEETEDEYVWGDAFKVEEVITNYLSNAIHHAKGEKRIRVFYTRREDILRVSVFNTGERIPEESISRIWEKFYKVDKARTREYGGNGIGLSIVKAIMDSFHQECGVKNCENGVEFWMELDRYRKHR